MIPSEMRSDHDLPGVTKLVLLHFGTFLAKKRMAWVLVTSRKHLRIHYGTDLISAVMQDNIIVVRAGNRSPPTSHLYNL